MSFSEPVPIIDFSRLLIGEDDPQAAATIHKACCDSGFFYLSHFGIDQDDIVAVEEAMQWFFALPARARQTVARTEESSRGYYNNELTKNIRDMKEVFDFGFKKNLNMPDDHAVNRTQDGWNQWPDVEGSDRFKKILTDYFDRCSGVAYTLLGVLTRNLGAPAETWKKDFYPNHSSFLRLNYYPVEDPLATGRGDDQKAVDTGNMGVHHHTDAGALTLLLQDHVGGLQVFHQEVWKDVPPVPGTLVVNIGDIVKVWSNDLYHAALHRVVASRHRDRYSVPFFYNPVYTANYQPLPEIRGDKVEPHYSPVNWGDFRHHRQHGDYGDYGDEIQISDYKII
jgi:isopenicillin N synthase-like dioxygenase